LPKAFGIASGMTGETQYAYEESYSPRVKAKLSYPWSRTKMGGWAAAQSPILVTTITLEKLRKRGYESMVDYHEK
jgi:hypothetical protein